MSSRGLCLQIEQSLEDKCNFDVGGDLFCLDFAAALPDYEWIENRGLVGPPATPS